MFAPRRSTLRCLIAAALGTPMVLGAQEPAQATGDSLRSATRGSWLPAPTFYGGWAAGAHNSQFRTRTGVPGHRDFYLIGVRIGWPLGRNDPARLVNGEYFIDLLPVAVSTGMPYYQWDRRCRPGFMCPGVTPSRHTVYAYGIAPLGWSLSIGGERARVILEASGGGLWFTRPVPDPEATRFNFTASVGPSLDVRVGPSSSLRLGYLWHHTSNGGTGRINPGLNSGILSVGLMYRAQHQRAETVALGSRPDDTGKAAAPR